MNLDDLDQLASIDADDMLGHIDALPEQVEDAWGYAQGLDVPATFGRADRIIICGMGGSAISGDLLAELVSDECNVPIIVNRRPELPAYVDGQDTLVIAVSYSGNTAETLAAFELANQRGTQLMVLTTGGQLAERAADYKAALWKFEYAAQPRAALGWMFTLLIAALVKIGLVSEKGEDVAATIKAMRRHRKVLTASSRVVKNPAKRMAGQLIGRIAIIYGAGLLAPVARRWKTQINENGKSWAHFEVLPELNHNAVAGILYPEELMTKLAIVQLTSPQFDSESITLSHDATRKLYLQQGLNIDSVKARGKSRLEAMFNALQFGDYTSWYLAMAYNINPTPVTPINLLKQAISGTI